MLKRFLFWFLVFFSIYFFIQSFNGKPQEARDIPTDVYITTEKERFTAGDFVIATVHNGREEAITIPVECPNEPLNVYYRDKSQWEKRESTANNVTCPTETIVVEPSGEYTFTYAPWNFDLFADAGQYKLEFTLPAITTEGGEETTFTTDAFFEIKKRGIFGTAWHQGFYRPIYNSLIYFTSVLPGHNFGWAIIILTLIIRLILLVPNQKALRSQREMQKVQPELEAIKRKHEGNQEVIAKKTMELWKQHKVNPMGSCLPLLIQLPILIGLFYVAQNGLNPYNTHLLYSGLRGFDTTLIQTQFLWLDLAEIDRYILPVIVGLLQFAQLKLVSAGIKKNKQPAGDGKKDMANAMQNMNTMMTYFMPVMIALMTASFPSGVGLYWGFSTLFGIGQQVAVNKEKRGKKKDKHTEGDVKVIDVTPEEPTT